MEGGLEAAVPGVLLSKVAGQADLWSIQHYVDGQQKSHKAISLVNSKKVGAKPRAEFKKICKHVAAEELEQKNVMIKDQDVDEEMKKTESH